VRVGFTSEHVDRTGEVERAIRRGHRLGFTEEAQPRGRGILDGAPVDGILMAL
jgi:hypothetical protein